MHSSTRTAVFIASTTMFSIAACRGTQSSGAPDPARDPDPATDGAAGNGDGNDGQPDAGPRSLFNGSNFEHWDRYLGKPSSAAPALGVNDDPRAVYSVVELDDEPAIRISGEVWGSLISQERFCNFQLQLEYQWGTALWPPLNAVDSGIMFLSTGPFGAVNAGGNALSEPIGTGAFLVSVEYQLAPGDLGAMYNLGPIAFSTLARTTPADLPTNAWNRVEIEVQDGIATHFLNGQQVARGSGFILNWPGEAATGLRCGKLQLQSEGAEIFFRRIEIRSRP